MPSTLESSVSSPALVPFERMKAPSCRIDTFGLLACPPQSQECVFAAPEAAGKAGGIWCGKTFIVVCLSVRPDGCCLKSPYSRKCCCRREETDTEYQLGGNGPGGIRVRCGCSVWPLVGCVRERVLAYQCLPGCPGRPSGHWQKSVRPCVSVLVHEIMGLGADDEQQDLLQGS